MDKQEYDDYVESFHAFMEKEEINCLSRQTPEDGEDLANCLSCNEEIDHDDHFSWHSCNCCGTTLGGSRIHASGFNPKTQEIQCYSICVDCEYFAEYGQLDDMTMLEIEESKHAA